MSWAPLAVVGLVALFAALVLLTLALMWWMHRIFARGSGYAELARRFPADHEPQGQKFTGQHVRVGAVRWRFCTTIVFSPEGLYLAVMAGVPVIGNPRFTGHPPVLIPWSEIREVRRTVLYWRRAVALTVGEPAVVTLAMYESFWPYIAQYVSVRPLEP